MAPDRNCAKPHSLYLLSIYIVKIVYKGLFKGKQNCLLTPICPPLSESVRNTPSTEPLPPAAASSQASCPSEIMVDPEGSYHGSTTTEEEPSYSSNLPPHRPAHPHAHAHPLKSFAVPAVPAGSHPSYETSALPSTPLLAQTG